jgi:hypothetical protein
VIGVDDIRLVGTTPALPWPLNRSSWFTNPERAERLAALRIGVALVLLWDVLFTYWPLVDVFFGQGSLGSPEIFSSAKHGWQRWSLFHHVGDLATYRIILLSWAGAALCLLLGVFPRLSACWAWLCSISILGVNYYLHNSGDNVRTIALFYLMLSPCGAVWTLPRWLRGHRRGIVYVPAWPLRLLFVQLATLYCINGMYKMASSEWSSGVLMHYVMANLGWTRMSYAMVPIPLALLQLQTWTVLFWEFSFPLLVLLPVTRKPTLILGILFHLGTGLLLQLGPFPFYMICLYLPLAPWEKWLEPAAKKAETQQMIVGKANVWSALQREVSPSSLSLDVSTPISD